MVRSSCRGWELPFAFLSTFTAVNCSRSPRVYRVRMGSLQSLFGCCALLLKEFIFFMGEGGSIMHDLNGETWYWCGVLYADKAGIIEGKKWRVMRSHKVSSTPENFNIEISLLDVSNFIRRNFPFNTNLEYITCYKTNKWSDKKIYQ